MDPLGLDGQMIHYGKLLDFIRSVFLHKPKRVIELLKKTAVFLAFDVRNSHHIALWARQECAQPLRIAGRRAKADIQLHLKTLHCKKQTKKTYRQYLQTLFWREKTFLLNIFCKKSKNCKKKIKQRKLQK